MFIKDKNGFSLSEVMISLVILAIGILGTINMFSASDKALDTSNQMNMALRQAQEKLESKKGANFDLLLLDDIDGDGISETRMEVDSALADGTSVYRGSDTSSGISRIWTISLYGGIARIDVSALWSDKNGIKRSLILSTIKSDGVY